MQLDQFVSLQLIIIDLQINHQEPIIKRPRVKYLCTKPLQPLKLQKNKQFKYIFVLITQPASPNCFVVNSNSRLHAQTQVNGILANGLKPKSMPINYCGLSEDNSRYLVYLHPRVENARFVQINFLRIALLCRLWSWRLTVMWKSGALVNSRCVMQFSKLIVF